MSKVAITAVAKPDLTDLSLPQTYCCECGRPIDTIPSWLAGAKVKFGCAIIHRQGDAPVGADAP